MYSYVKFYEKDNDLYEIYFQVGLGGFKGSKSCWWKFKYLWFNETKIIFLMFTGNQDFYLGVYTDLIIATGKNDESHISSVNRFDKSSSFRV